MKLFHKILIANRGEIALRILRSVRKMGIQVVSIYAQNDADAPHVLESDEAYPLGDGALSSTYLNINLIVDIARNAGCDAIHPGYGFLSENPLFIRACNDAGITFIGPSAEVVSLMGNKVEARRTVAALGIPLLEGRTGLVEDILKDAYQLHYPVLVKAAAGGGGKGMRIVRSAEGLEEALDAASREASAYFGDPSVYVEQYLDAPRHIEVQVFGDHYGNAVHLFERECSIQRRYQKIIEEAPSPTLNDESRHRITSAAVTIASSIGYYNAGTIEFLVDEDMNHYFLEMNTRIQVEHPVTERITGIDIVEQQVLVAASYPLAFRQDEISIKGHAIECRLYAEDPENQFLPSPGKMVFYQEPKDEDIRVDSGINRSLVVSADYDPMMAKIISWGLNREIAIERMRQALHHTVVHGIASNVQFLAGILRNDAFLHNQISTRFCDDQMERIRSGNKPDPELFAAAYLMWWLYYPRARKGNRLDTWDQIGFWRLNPLIRLSVVDQPILIHYKAYKPGYCELTLNTGSPKEVRLVSVTSDHVVITINGERYQAYVSETNQQQAWVSLQGITIGVFREDLLVQEDEFHHETSLGGKDSGNIVSSMPGKVVKVNVTKGDKINKGDVLLIVEAMKMENAILAPVDGLVEEIFVVKGDKVDTTTTLLSLDTMPSEVVRDSSENHL